MNISPSSLSGKLATILVFIVTSSFCSLICAQNEDSEYRQKAKIIRFLAGEVGWPANIIKNQTVNVCLLGQFSDPKALSALNNKRINNRSIKISPLKNYRDNNQCQIIYVANNESPHLLDIIKTFENQPVLLLGDMDKFALQGGSMNFMMLNNVVALTINYDSLKKSQLKLSLKGFDQVTVIPEEEDLSTQNKK